MPKPSTPIADRAMKINAFRARFGVTYLSVLCAIGVLYIYAVFTDGLIIIEHALTWCLSLPDIGHYLQDYAASLLFKSVLLGSMLYVYARFFMRAMAIYPKLSDKLARWYGL